METKGTKIAGRIVDDKDSEWYTTHTQLVTRNQAGNKSGTGNYMQVDGGAVKTNAVSNNQKTHFNMHSYLEENPAGGYRPIVILENEHDGRVVAINKDEDSVIAKVLPTSLSDFTTLEKVKTAHPEILFYKELSGKGSDYFYFKSYLTDKQRILGFGANGIALNPTQVQSTRDECLFFMQTPPPSPPPSS